MCEKSDLIKSIKCKIEQYCAYQERCHTEVVSKIKLMGVVLPAVIDTIVADLISSGFLNEERFARNFALGKLHQKKWGKVKINKELQFRQISSHNINMALNDLENDYITVFNKFSKHLCDSVQEKDNYKKRKKISNRLLYKGWESGLVYDRLYELLPP